MEENSDWKTNTGNNVGFILRYLTHIVGCSRALSREGKKMTTAGLEPATFWYRWAIEAKRATIALGSH